MSEVKRWQRGEVILMEQFTQYKGSIWRMPQIVIEDCSRYLAVVSLPGMTFLTREEHDLSTMTGEERVALFLEPELRQLQWRERVSNRRAVVSLYPPGEAHSYRLFFDPEWRFQSWYVNLERPYWRLPNGIRVQDRILDIVVTPDLKWSWKDKEDFDLLCEVGYFNPEEAEAIRAEGAKVLARLEARDWPFNEPWPEWRPEPSWRAPRIADHWPSSM